jgi:hypothetical protein
MLVIMDLDRLREVEFESDVTGKAEAGVQLGCNQGRINKGKLSFTT